MVGTDLGVHCNHNCIECNQVMPVVAPVAIAAVVAAVTVVVG